MFFIILFVIVLTISLLIILASGLFIVKDNQVAVFEKMYKFLCVKEKGIYFFTPFLTRRVGYYTLEVQYIKFKIEDRTYYIAYKIQDAYKFHYAGHDFKDIIYSTCLENKNDIQAMINYKIEEYGLVLIDLKIA